MPVRNTIAKAFATADQVVLRSQEDVRVRTMELMFNPETRDPIIFYQALDAAGVDPEMWINVTPEDLNDIDPNDRQLDWMAVQAALSAAAVQQARLELVYRPLMEKASQGAQAIVKDNSKLSNEQRKVAATEGTGKARFKAAEDALTNGR